MKSPDTLTTTTPQASGAPGLAAGLACLAGVCGACMFRNQCLGHCRLYGEDVTLERLGEPFWICRDMHKHSLVPAGRLVQRNGAGDGDVPRLQVTPCAEMAGLATKTGPAWTLAKAVLRAMALAKTKVLVAVCVGMVVVATAGVVVARQLALRGMRMAGGGQVAAGKAGERIPQKPKISVADLAQIIESKRDSIVTLRTSMTVEHKMADGERSWEKQRDFALSANKLFVSEKRGKSLTSPDTQFVHAYDGERVRKYEQYVEIEPRGTIEQFQGRATFIDTDDVLGASMLVDAKKDLGTEWLVHDLVAYLKSAGAVVLEQTQNVDGHDCIVVTLGAPAVFQVYLDPARGYAVTRFEQYDLRYATNNMVTSRALSSMWQNTDFEDHGNGVWLPKKVTHDWLSPKGEVEARRTTKLASVQVNGKIDPKLFTDVFPEGARIWDVTKKLHYEIKPDSSIEDVINEAVQAAKSLEAAGAKIDCIVAVIDREEGARQNIEAAGYRFQSLFTTTDLGLKPEKR